MIDKYSYHWIPAGTSIVSVVAANVSLGTQIISNSDIYLKYWYSRIKKMLTGNTLEGSRLISSHLIQQGILKYVSIHVGQYTENNKHTKKPRGVLPALNLSSLSRVAIPAMMGVDALVPS